MTRSTVRCGQAPLAGLDPPMSCAPDIDWNALDFASFARLAGDVSLSKYQKIGFPDSYRAGFEEKIFADICAKLPRLRDRDLTVLDIGPGCSDLPMMLIELCRAQGHRLCFVDSAEMLAQLPDAPFIDKRPGLFPKCRAALADLRGGVAVALCYSVLHYVFVDANVFDFVDVAIELLAPGGEMLIGDIPNASKRARFFASDAGIAFHRRFTGGESPPPPAEASPARGKLDDAAVLGLLARARAADADAYVVPQGPGLPMANRREDILLRRP
jgi:hypothetical protein